MSARLPPIGFWSYSRSDDRSSGGRLAQLCTLFADELQQLHGRTPINLFRDTSAIPPGAEWEAMIEANLANATFIIPILTPASVESEWCTREINLFRARERAIMREHPELAGRRRIFPIHYIHTGDADPVDPALYAELKRLQWTDFRDLRLVDPDSFRVRKVLSTLAAEVNRLLLTKVGGPATIDRPPAAGTVAVPADDAASPRRSRGTRIPMATTTALIGPPKAAVTTADDAGRHRGTGAVADDADPPRGGTTLRIRHDKVPPAAPAISPAGHDRSETRTRSPMLLLPAGAIEIPPIGPPLLHKGAVRTAAFAPDGRRLVTASDDQTARLWDPSTGMPIGAAMPHDGAVVAAAFSPDGRLVVTASHDCTVRLWDATNGQPVGQVMHHDYGVQSVAFSPDGSRLVTTTASSRTITIWSVRWCMRIDVNIRHKALIHSAVFSPSSLHVLTAADDNIAQLWNADTGAPVGAAMQHLRSVFSASMSADGQSIVTASDDSTARLWEPLTGHPVGLPMRHSDAVIAAAFSPDGGRIVTTSLNNSAQLWDAARNTPIGAAMQHDKPIGCAAFSPDGSRLVTASGDARAQLWDGWTAAPIGPPLEHRDWVRHAAFSPNGRRVVTASWDHSARLWDVSATVHGAR